jgi:hypothetical protein
MSACVSFFELFGPFRFVATLCVAISHVAILCGAKLNEGAAARLTMARPQGTCLP